MLAVLAAYVSKPSLEFCDFGFACILAIFYFDTDRWNEQRVGSFLRLLPIHANKANAHASAGDVSSLGSGLVIGPTQRLRTRSRTKSVVDENDDTVPKIYRPWLIYFGIIDNIIRRSATAQDSEVTALEATQQLAKETREVLVSSHSLSSVANFLAMSPGKLRDSLNEPMIKL